MKDALKALVVSAIMTVPTMRRFLAVALAASAFITEAAAQTSPRINVEASHDARQQFSAPIVVKNRDGLVIDNRLKIADFTEFCAGQRWPRKWATEGPFHVLNCGPNAEATSGRRRKSPVSIYFRRDLGEFYELVKITDPRGTKSRKEVVEYINRIVDSMTDQRSLGNPAYPGKVAPNSDAAKFDPNHPKLINAQRMFGLEVMLNDQNRGLAATGKEVPEIARRCSVQKDGKFSYREVDANTLVLSCTQTMDFIEHPNTKPTVTTFTYTFKEQHSHVLLESVTTNHGYTFTASEIGKLIKMPDED